MKLFSSEELRQLMDRPEDLSVSIYMPTEKAGKEVKQNGIRFKNLLRGAAEQIEEEGLLRATEVQPFLQPAYELVDNSPFWQHQREGLALFVSRDLFLHYRLPLRLQELVVVDRRFHVKPLFQLLTGDGRFYVLSLSRGQIKLYESTRYEVSEVELADTPTRFEDVVGTEVEEQHLQWHTGTGAGRGGRAAQFHGQGGGEDDLKPEIRKFLAAVDRGVRKELQGREAPLVLAGIEYLLPIYREVSAYPQLVDEVVPVNAAALKLGELREKAWQAVRPRFVKDRKEAKDRFLDLAGTGKASANLEEILRSTRSGRIEALFVARGVQQWGTFDAERDKVSFDAGPGNGNQDLLDYAAVQTVLHGGKVFVVDRGEMPHPEAPAAALFRY